MTTAFVLSGGASLGAVEVGMLTALGERDIRPDLIVGTSVGALNGAWLAGHPDAPIGDLAHVWKELHRSDVFPWDPRRGEVLTGREVLLSSGPTIDAVLASAALPALFDPVEVAGVEYMDGGVGNNTPISHAVSLGVDRIWVLSAGYACALTEAPSNPLAMGLHALNLLLHKQLVVDVQRYESEVELRVLPPLCPLTVSPIDFSHSDELIDRAYNAAIGWLDEDHPTLGQAEFMGLHDHILD